MKIIVAVLALAVGAVHGTYSPYYPGFNPYAAAWSALGLYNPYVAPVVPHLPPVSGTYAYHDGIRPTVVQANNDGFAYPHAVNGLYSSSHLLHPYAASVGYYGHGHVYPQKTVVQANLGAGHPWGLGALYGSGVYGVGYHNYVPTSIAKYLIA